MESTTSLSSTKKPRRHYGLGAVRRLPSRVFREQNTRSSSPTPPEHSSDSTSTESFFTASSLELASIESKTSPSTKKPRWHRGLGAVRRRVFMELNIRSSSPTPSEGEHNSDSNSTKGFSKASSLEILPDTVAASPPAAEGNVAWSHSASDPKGVNTEREAAPLASEPGGHAVLIREMFTASPENTLELPIITKDIAFVHAPPAAAEPLVLTSEPEEMMIVPEATLRPTDEEELVQTHITKTLHGIEEPAGQNGNENAVLKDPFADPSPHEAAPYNTIWASFPTPSRRTSDSDSTSVGHSSKASSVKLLDAVPLSSAKPAANDNRMEASLSVESFTREATTLASEPVPYASLMDWEMLAASLENTHEVPTVVNEIGSIRPIPATVEQSLIHVEDMPTDLTQSSVETGPISNFDILASRAILGPSMDTNDNPSQIWTDLNSRSRASTESSAAPVQRRNGNKGQGQRKSIVLMSSEDPLADRQPNKPTPDVSVTDTTLVPEPLHLRSLREGQHKLDMHMSLPSTQDAIGQTALQNHLGKMIHPARRVRESTNGRNSPIAKAHRDDSNIPDSSINWPILISAVASVVSLLVFAFRKAVGVP